MSLGGSDRPPARLLGTAALGAGTVLAAGAVGALPALIVVALAGSGVAVPCALGLLGRGRSGRATTGGGYRCAAVLGTGTLSGGLTGAVLPLLAPEQQPLAAAAGTGLTAILLGAGLLHLPGVAGSAGRLRLGLDSVVVGTSAVLVGWLLAPGLGAERPATQLAVAVVASLVAVTVTVALRTCAPWPVVAGCAAGAVSTVVGLALVVVALTSSAPRWGLLLAAVLVTCAPSLTWLGVARLGSAAGPAPGRGVAGTPGGHAGQVNAGGAPLVAGGGPVRVDPRARGYPTIALPVGAVVLAMSYHLLVTGTPDRPAMWLGMALGTTLAIREWPAAADLRRMDRQLADQQAALRALVAAGCDAVLVLDGGLTVRWQAGGEGTLLALPDGTGERLTGLLHPDDVPEVVDRLRAVSTDPSAAPVFVARLRDRDGRWCRAECTVGDLRGRPEIAALVIWVRCATGHPRQELRRLSGPDRLTGLPGRRALRSAVDAFRSGHHGGALLAVELAGFPELNEQRGTRAGDAVLRTAGQRITAVVGEEGFVARSGERQFGVVTAAGPAQAHALAHRMLAALATPYPLPGGGHRLAPRIGICRLAEGCDAAELVRRAERALASAGGSEQAPIEWYDRGLDQPQVRRGDLERHLPGAVGRGELELLYQPILELSAHRPVAVEALLRWRHPGLGTVPPAELLPVAERLGIAPEIGEWVLHTACQQVARWRGDGHDLGLSVNVSVSHLAGTPLDREVAAALMVHQLPPEKLTVEVSEPQIAGADLAEVAAALSRLRAIGVRTALDDFGGVGTDPDRLRRLPLDQVKLCPSVVAALAGPGHEGATPPGGAGSAGEWPGSTGEWPGPTGDWAGAGLAGAVQELAGRFGLAVVAEGVEREWQRRLLVDAECRLGQGFLLAAPVAAAQLPWHLRRPERVGR